MGSTIILAPDPGVTITMVRNSVGVIASPQPDGSILITIATADVTLVDLRFIPAGPSGLGYTITTNISIAPFTEDIDVILQ